MFRGIDMILTIYMYVIDLLGIAFVDSCVFSPLVIFQDKVWTLLGFVRNQRLTFIYSSGHWSWIVHSYLCLSLKGAFGWQKQTFYFDHKPFFLRKLCFSEFFLIFILNMCDLLLFWEKRRVNFLNVLKKRFYGIF